MIEDQRSARAVDPPAADEDPAGEVMIPPGRRAIIRAPGAGRHGGRIEHDLRGPGQGDNDPQPLTERCRFAGTSGVNVYRGYR